MSALLTHWFLPIESDLVGEMGERRGAHLAGPSPLTGLASRMSKWLQDLVLWCDGLDGLYLKYSYA